MTLTIETILRGTGLGPMQSVGQMQVIPLLSLDERDDDASFAPPTLEVGTQGYGTVLLRNVNDLPTIVPPGAGWVVEQRAQDHAIAGGTFLRPGEEKAIKTAMCIQQTQGGLITQAKHALTILPAALRAKALSIRHVEDFRKLWDAIGSFNGDLGVSGGGNNLVAFLDAFRKQLDEFVAEFEIVSHQIGAIILVGGEIVGIERTPSTAYFRAVWEPLVRVCYGSLAVSVSKTRALAGGGPPATRLPLLVLDRTVEGLRTALREVRERESRLTAQLVTWLQSLRLTVADHDEDVLTLPDSVGGGDVRLTTVAATKFAGQIATRGSRGDARIAYASLSLA